MRSGIVTLPSAMDFYDVREMFSRYYVDPDIAQQIVPATWKVKIHDNGKALLLVMVQACKKMVLDYLINMGSVKMSHIWIELDGPPEIVVPLPETTRSLPTWYWYILPHELDRFLTRMIFGFAGVDARLVRKISLGGEPGRSRSGEVIERHSPEAKYRWTESVHLYPKPDIVTGSHRFFRQYGACQSEAHATCVTHFLGDGAVSLEATNNSVIGKLGFGNSLSGFSNPVWVKHCHVKYRVSCF